MRTAVLSFLVLVPVVFLSGCSQIPGFSSGSSDEDSDAGNSGGNTTATPPAVEDTEGPSRLELDGATHRIEELEHEVERHRGAPFDLKHHGEALERVAQLYERYPSNPAVLDLRERGRRALLASQGVAMEVTEEMTAYRRAAEEIKQTFHDLSQDAYDDLMARLEADETAITDPFPAPDPMSTPADDMVDRTIVIPEFEYPMNMISSLGHSYVYVGSGARGMYYVDLSVRNWFGAYEAVRRYRRFIGGEISQEVKWTIIGTVQPAILAVPQAGEEPVRTALFGWVVIPQYIWIPGFVLTVADPESELGGRFVGEDRVEEIKAPYISIREVPEDASPEEVVHAWMTALKERNYDLFMAMIDPHRRETATQVDLCNYHWDFHCERWWKYYVHYQIVGEPEINVVSGLQLDPTEASFLSEEEIEELRRHAGPTERVAKFQIRFFDENGRQNRRPQNFYLRQYEDGRWWVDGPHLPN